MYYYIKWVDLTLLEAVAVLTKISRVANIHAQNIGISSKFLTPYLGLKSMGKTGYGSVIQAKSKTVFEDLGAKNLSFDELMFLNVELERNRCYIHVRTGDIRFSKKAILLDDYHLISVREG